MRKWERREGRKEGIKLNTTYIDFSV